MSTTVKSEIHVLHVDGNKTLRDETRAGLEGTDDRFTVEAAASADEGLARLVDRPPDCVITSAEIPGTEGLDFLRTVRERQSTLPVIFLASNESECTATRALSAGATDCLPQSSDEQYELLATRVRNAVDHQRVTQQLQASQNECATVFEAAQNGLLLVDVEEDGFRYQQCNPRAVELIGRDRDAIVGANPRDALGPRDGQKVVGAYRTCLDRRETIEYVVTIDLPVGEVIRECRVTPVESDGDIERLVVAFHDITDRVHRQQELDAERQFVQQLLDSLEDLFYVLDEEGTLQRWNEKLPAITGYTEEELSGTPALEFFPADHHETVADGIDRVLSEGGATIEAALVTADGEQIPHEFRGRRLTDSDGQTRGIVGIGRDVSERRQREQELQRYRTVFNELPDPVVVYDDNGQYDLVNDAVTDIRDLSRAELEGTESPYLAQIRQENAAEYEALLDGSRDTLRVELTDEFAGQGQRTLECRLSRVPGESESESIVIVTRDVTERTERQRELGEIKSQYQTLVENYPDGAVFLYDTELRVVRAGGTELSAVGLSAQAVEGAKPHHRYPDEIATELTDYIEQALAGESNTFTQEYEGKHYRVRAVPVRTDEGTITHAMLVSENVTDRVRREQELRQKTRAIEEAPVGITITDPSQPDNPMTYVNDTFVRMTGYSREEAVGRNCRFLQGEETSPDRVETLRTGIENEEPVATALRNYRNDETMFWNRVEIAPVYDDTGELVNYIGFQQDITEQKESERALEKRERILRELNTATNEFYPPDSETDIGEFLVEFVESAFGFEYVSVKQFDEETGCLEPVSHAGTTDDTAGPGAICPGSGPVWEVYRHGESRVFDGSRLKAHGISANQSLVVPIGDFGVALAYTTGDKTFDEVDRELIEVVAANSESSFQRLQSDRVRTDLVEQLSTQQAKVADYRSVIDAIQSIQRGLAESDSQEALETGVCDELLETDQIDFVWIGRPRGGDTSLSPSTWAGDGAGYLDAVDPGEPQTELPAQRAARERDTYCQDSIAALVVDEAWSKDAISAGFGSVLSVPLVYDDVVYGVLTAYSHEEDAFDQVYQHFLADVASLVVNYSRILEQRYGESHKEYTELEFDLSDPTYPLQQLASKAGSRLRFDTVAENTTGEIRILVTVVDGSAEQTLAAASSVNRVVETAWFGDDDHNQLALTIEKPFLASVVGKHGGELVHSLSDESGTRFRVKLPQSTAKRPLLDALHSRYREIEPVVQRQRTASRAVGDGQLEEILTDRQYEILNAAYHGGYYETPRQVTGQDLADSFGISSPAIYNHLQSAHQSLLETALGERDGIAADTGRLNM